MRITPPGYFYHIFGCCRVNTVDELGDYPTPTRQKITVAVAELSRSGFHVRIGAEGIIPESLPKIIGREENNSSVGDTFRRPVPTYVEIGAARRILTKGPPSVFSSSAYSRKSRSIMRSIASCRPISTFGPPVYGGGSNALARCRMIPKSDAQH